MADIVYPHTFADGAGNVASGVAVMDNFNAAKDKIDACTSAVVTVLPGSPVDGQGIAFLADATNGVVWHLRYRAASASAYKWEFVGGSCLYANVDTLSATGSAGYADLPSSVGPSLTTPLAGDYLIEIGALTQTLGQQVAMSYQVGASAATDADAIWGFGNSSITYASVAGKRRKTGLAALTAVVARYKSSAAGGTFLDRWMSIQPVRVG